MAATLGKVAVGLASLVLGAKYLHTGAKHLSAASDERRQSTPRSLGLGSLDKATQNTGFLPTQHGPMRMRTYEAKSIEDRIRKLRQHVDQGRRDPRIYAFARAAITQKCNGDWCIKEKDNIGEANAIFDATRKQIRYTSDIAGIDTYQKPAHTLALQSGDCDDFSSFLCSALLSVGIPCRFKVIRTVGGNDWNHIYVQAGFPRARPTKWISMDASVPVKFGWEAPRHMVAAERVFPVG